MIEGMSPKAFGETDSNEWNNHDLNCVMIQLGIATGVNTAIGYEGPPKDNDWIMRRALELITKGLKQENRYVY